MSGSDSVVNDSEQTAVSSDEVIELTREQRAIAALSIMAAEDTLFAEKLYYAMNAVFLYEDEIEHMVKWGKRVRQLGARTDKDFGGESMILRFNFGDPDSYAHLGITVNRKAVCTPRIVGKETVTVKDFNACPTKEIERDIVEWDCGSIISAAAGDSEE